MGAAEAGALAVSTVGPCPALLSLHTLPCLSSEAPRGVHSLLVVTAPCDSCEDATPHRVHLARGSGGLSTAGRARDWLLKASLAA